MADREVQIQLSKMRGELKKLLLTSVAILEEVQGQNPSTWGQFSEMMRTAAVESDLEEREQSLDMSWRSSLVALGINTKYHLHFSVDKKERVDNGPLVIKQWTLRWIDVTTGQEELAIKCRPEELNFALACEEHQVQVTLDRILTILREVVSALSFEFFSNP